MISSGVAPFRLPRTRVLHPPQPRRSKQTLCLDIAPPQGVVATGRLVLIWLYGHIARRLAQLVLVFYNKHFKSILKMLYQFGTRVRTNILHYLKNNLKYKHSGATGTLASGRCQHIAIEVP
jgi:hypothetical protein